MAPFTLSIAFKPIIFRRDEGFPRHVDTDRYTQCTDQRAINDGYYIGRSPEEFWRFLAFDAKYVWDDDSSEEPNLLAHLDVLTIGQCNHLYTEEDSRKCGVGKELMKLCLGDKTVTGGSTEHWQITGPAEWDMWKDEQFNYEVGQLCKAINLIQCANDEFDDTPTRICKVYIESAKETGYEMMFSETYEHDNKYVVMKIADAEQEFISDPDKLVDSKGGIWFFCKCDPEQKEECHKLVEHGYHPGN